MTNAGSSRKAQTQMPREEYLQLHKVYEEGEQKAYESFDKAILTIASAAFGVSLALAQYMASAHPLTQTWLLAGAWVGFIAAILSTLVSFLVSQAAFRRQHELLAQEYYGGAPAVAGTNRFGWLTDKLNWLSAIAFVVGVAFIACFVYANLV